MSGERSAPDPGDQTSPGDGQPLRVRIYQTWQHRETGVRRTVLRHGRARVNVLIGCRACREQAWISYDDLRTQYALIQEAPGW